MFPLDLLGLDVRRSLDGGRRRGRFDGGDGRVDDHDVGGGEVDERSDDERKDDREDLRTEKESQESGSASTSIGREGRSGKAETGPGGRRTHDLRRDEQSIDSITSDRNSDGDGGNNTDETGEDSSPGRKEDGKRVSETKNEERRGEEKERLT